MYGFIIKPLFSNSRVVEALIYGAYMLGQSLVYAPGFSAAKDCGARVLSVIQRQPCVITEPGVMDTPHWVNGFIFIDV